MIEGQEGVSWPQWLALAQACEDHGIGTMFRSDHYLSFSEPARRGSLDAWTLIAALAARTTTLRLGTLVSPATFRHPAVVANAAATVDIVSGGRVELGLGAGWMTAEHESYGFSFPPAGERVAIFAEQLEIVHRWFGDGPFSFEGRHYRLVDCPGLPTPVQRPRPPLIVGGSAKPGTAVPAARFADEYNTPFADAEEFSRVRDRVRAACENEGRDPETMRVSLMTGFVVGDRAEERARDLYGNLGTIIYGSLEQVAERLRDLAARGCDRVMLQHLRHEEVETVELIGRELAPLVG